jgi:hypothetical protein
MDSSQFFVGIPAVFVLVFIGFVGLIIIGIVYAIRAAAKRRAELLALAGELRLTFSEADPFNIPNMYGNFDVLSQGEDQEASNVLYGQISGYDIKAFDFEYQTEETDTDSEGHTTTSHQSHYFSAVIVDTAVIFKKLNIRPEGFLDRVAGAIGFNDIDFESDEFSRKFYVKSEDKKFAYDIIHPRMMDYLLSKPGWSIQVLGRSILVENNRVFSKDEFRQCIEFIKGFLALVPEYVWQTLRGG